MEILPRLVRRARKKGIRLGSLEEYCSMFRHSPRNDLVRLYTAFYGERPVYSAVVLRSHSTVHQLIAALDEDILDLKPTPSCLLIWEAMRDYRDLGCSWYNLGGRSGSVYEFKRRFRPSEVPSPITVTLVLRPLLFRIWSCCLAPLVTGVLRGANLLGGG